MNTFLLTRKSDNKFSSYGKTIRLAGRFFLVLSGSFCLGTAMGQTDKRLVLADKYYKAGDYYTAAGLYGQFLDPSIKSKSTSDFPLNTNRNAEGRTGSYADKTAILFKQAESYRLANYWNEASALYKKCFEKDSISHAAALYWHAVCERSLGNYDNADQSINLFLKKYANANSLKQAAIKEKETIQFIRKELSRPDTVLYQISKINSSFGKQNGMFAPVAANDEIIITSTQSDSVAEGVNPYHNRLFITSMSNGNLENARTVRFTGLDGSFNQGTASFSANGNYMYLTQWKYENGQQVSAIYLSTKTANGWSRPTLLPNINKAGFVSKQPSITKDGKYLFFASNMKGGKGGFDIWYAPINEKGSTGQPVNSTGINTAGNEQAPFYHEASGTLVFASDRMPGMGGYDLYISKGREKEWEAPQNMGYPVNSSRDDVYFYSTGNNILDHAFFSSDRGSECCLATYQVAKMPKKKLMAGLVYDCRQNEPLADAEVIMKDDAGNVVLTRTNAEGKYMFEFSDNKKYQISLNKDMYLDKTADVQIESRNETAWHTDTLVNTALCMEKKLVIKVENVVTVYFEFDRSSIQDHEKSKLDSIYNIMMEDTTATLQISGYTDGKGSVEYNAKLSDKRARSCAEYLMQKGIDSTRISFESFGACCPVEMELLNGRDNPDGRSMNRRALINISRKEE